MAKTKSPTPQELYRARKQKEEQEKAAALPPGLINHGNTCFMNSVLQGLIATPLLSELAHFDPIPPSVQQHASTALASKRSPLLTNGRSVGGSFRKEWVDSMPIGDVFLSVMYKAWDMQEQHRRESMSPKSLLQALGRKYDQYQDFAQQDAHEFLRILLDATRMEEQDVIKKRQPPPSASNHKNRRRRTITPGNVNSRSSNPTIPEEGESAIPEEDRLISLSDMIFGGKLTSILVCQKCKHVSQTYEDFSDLSLSIKGEDYPVRKRDRLKNLAKRFTSFPAQTLGVISDMPRPLSVPPSSRDKEVQYNGGHSEPETTSEPSRSLDVGSQTERMEQDADGEQSAASKEDDTTMENDGSRVIVNGVDSLDEAPAEVQSTGRAEKKEKKDDGWAKLSRRISMRVGLVKQKDRRMNRFSERFSQEFFRDPPDDDPSKVDGDKENAHPNGVSENNHHPAPAIYLSRPSLSSSSDAPAPAARHVKLNASHPSKIPEVHRARSPKPPKPSHAESEYLRRVLADVNHPTLHPFSLFRPVHHNDTGLPSPSSHNLWLNMTGFTGLEECMRSFTSVEFLDGDNMVGCRRCWKIANGAYDGSSENGHGSVEDDSDSEEGGTPAVDIKTEMRRPALSSSLVHLPTSMSTPTMSFYSNLDSDQRSVSSMPPEPTDAPEPDEGAPSQTNSSALNGEPIPSIHTTVPVPPRRPTGPRLPTANGKGVPEVIRSSVSSPGSIQAPPARPAPRLGQVLSHLPSKPADSLPIPSAQRQRHKGELDSAEDSSGTESEVSVATSSRSVESSSTSPGYSDAAAKQRASRPTSPNRKTSRPKPVTMRPAYKRYLIAAPPPVLVIHLKRFQQLSKTMISFSHGFRKLDDYISFPEYLDLTPYLAPRKEDFGLGKKAKRHSASAKNDERCMYRLYAVVVHIGNMLGGHYIAYTALPSSDNTPRPPFSSDEKTNSSTGSRPERQWAYISDTVVRLTTLDEVLKAKAYICMYERI